MMDASLTSQLLASLLGFVLLGCNSGDDAAGDGVDTTGETGEDVEALTWWRDVEPVVRDKCGGCHSPDSVAPFSLETHAEFVALAPVLAPAIESGDMPPWGADPDCNSYSNDRSLTLEQEELLLTYIAGEMPEGDPADAPPDGPPKRELMPDVVVEMPEAYTPQTTPDDYRCFLVPWPEEVSEDQFVTAVEVYPGERSIVHHVIMFVASPSDVDAFVALDEAEAGPGYTCFGGPGQPSGLPPRWLGAWVPGVEPFFAPDDVGMRVEPGSMLIMQMHYNSMPGSELADRSSIGIEYQASVERPAAILPLADVAWLAQDGSMAIPAGDPDVTHEVSADRSHPILANIIVNGLGAALDAPLEIHDGGLHMHLFGERGRIEIRDPGGGNEQCIADVPEWDFNWQGSFTLDQPLLLTADRELHLQCWWDNSAENQPIVDGEQLEPIDRDWGDGTLDEMCLGIMYVTEAK